MKRILLVSFITMLMISCGPGKQFFEGGEPTIAEGITDIRLTMVNDLPLCNVQIDGRGYVFLVDTGAPTVISEELYQQLGLEPKYNKKMGDSQRKKQRQKFVVLPEIRLQNLVFRDIGCAVIDIRGELKCFGLDGIIGANMLAEAFFEFDYQNNRLRVARDKSPFSVDKADFVLNFKPRLQKTPKVKGQFFGREINFTFDTGSAGYIKVDNDFDFYKSRTPVNKFLSVNGITGIGAYGHGESANVFISKNTIQLDDIRFENEIVDSGNSNLIGNKFLKDYVFVIDWQSNKIFFRKNPTVKEKRFDGFGFGYLFVDGRATVVSKIEGKDVPVNPGDEILAIDDLAFNELKPEDHCKYYINKVEEKKDHISLKVKRNEQVLAFEMDRKVFLE